MKKSYVIKNLNRKLYFGGYYTRYNTLNDWEKHIDNAQLYSNKEDCLAQLEEIISKEEIHKFKIVKVYHA